MKENSYPECTMKRPDVEVVVDREFQDSFSKNYRVLPMFEKGLYEYKYKKHYSLISNEFLHCRWRSYIHKFESRKFEPFMFINVRDFHFYNQLTHLIASESVHRKTDFRHKLKQGPGVDIRGQMPIPQELLMKRGTPTTEIKIKKHTKMNKDGKTHEEDKKDNF